MQTTPLSMIESLMGQRGLLLSLLLILLLVSKEFVQAAGGARARFWSSLITAAVVPLLVAFGLTVALRLEQGGRGYPARSATSEPAPPQSGQERAP